MIHISNLFFVMCNLIFALCFIFSGAPRGNSHAKGGILQEMVNHKVVDLSTIMAEANGIKNFILHCHTTIINSTSYNFRHYAFLNGKPFSNF